MSSYGKTEAETLRTLVRRVDKNLTYEVRPAPDPEFIILSLRQGKQSGEVQLRIKAIQDADNTLVEREQLRMRIKRARDAMWANVGKVPLRSNRHERAEAPEGNSFFRAGGGGPRGGRR